MAKRIRIAHQRPIKGQPRQTLPAVVQTDIEEAVKFISTEYGVSRSWVVATALAQFFDIKIERFDRRKNKK